MTSDERKEEEEKRDRDEKPKPVKHIVSLVREDGETFWRCTCGYETGFVDPAITHMRRAR